MSRVYVIGGANIDIQGYSHKPLMFQDSNVGSVSYSYGGVARNIAENLVLLQDKVSFISAIGQDVFGENMYQYCEHIGMDMSNCIRPKCNTSIYLAIMDNKNDMALAINDMAILEHIDHKLLDKVFAKIHPDDVMVMDTNLEEKMITYMLEKCPCPIYLDPISSIKAKKAIHHLANVYMLKPNRLEAEAMSGIYLGDKENYVKCLDYFLEQGVNEVVISLGKEGVIATNGKQKVWIRHAFVEMKNATGAGDAFLAGYIHKALAKEDFISCVKCAIASAIINVQSTYTVSEKMFITEIENVLNTVEMEIEELC
ncbi:MAG: bifunctional hydroxymethylpyrimidine kinase/phosphomethylpyrimidine kinase [Erysipelotrichaceae bacterium]|nr:bifunctional hydroxymethylpyrimidine kinase/phosphomethylpyrimidine kinase [Erysipelotrichaceae bacterium]